MSNLSTYISVLAASCALCSCEGVTEHEYTVVNNTTATVRYEVETFASTMTDSILPGERAVVAYYELRGGNKKSMKAPYQMEEFRLVKSDDTLSIDDVLSSWDIESDHVRRVPSHYKHTYKLKLTNDFFTE